ncbi:UDP-glycosyltransferase [Flavobacterium sp. HTF]|uniref:UDP-glycosyltransferase n=1 Tax=Flavobacterium sp. HTF TaxID=2170732 RepID=UPI000D5E87CF|nr:UDP-glycosyltransferase [Flavobacterium sp. HTF]PWB21808.1 UDP-glycosyltransferase [Flavobacterium sp. HTF]
MIKKILIVVDSINIEDSSGSKANVALINNLQEAGFEVLVYHYTRKNINLKNVNTFEIPEIKSNISYFLSRSQRVFSRHFKVNLAPFFEKRFGFSFTFFNDIKSISSALKKQSFEPDLVLTLSKGASFRPHYAVLKLPHLHKKWMAYIHDPYPFHYYPRPYNWVEPGYDFKELFFKELSQKAKYSAFPSQLLKEWMSSYFPDFSKTGIIIPHQNEKYEVQNTSFPSYFDVSKFHLLHAGNLMKQRSPEGLLKGFILFLENNPSAKEDAKLILLGDASYHTEMLKQYNIPEIYIHNGNKAFDEVYHLQKNVSVNIILEAKGEISPFLPAKFPHCVEADKTILSLAPYYSETRRLLGEDYPFWSEVDDVKKIASLIGKLYQLWKQNPDSLLLSRKDLEDYISVTHLKEVLKKL